MNAIIKLMSGAADGEKLYAKIGRWLGSPEVRRECGGYPLNDGDGFFWLVALDKRGLSPVGFLSYQFSDKGAILHNAFVEAPQRGNGIFREMRRQCMASIDHQHLQAVATVQEKTAAALAAHGFVEVSRRGAWIKIERKAR